MKLCLVGILIAVAATAHAETKAISDTQGAKELAESVMKRVVDGDLPGAFELLKPHWPLPEYEISQIVLQSVQQRSAVASRWGKPVGFEYVSWTAVGDSLVRFVYLEKFENHPLVWAFHFYKANDTWKVNSVAWSDRPQELFR